MNDETILHIIINKHLQKYEKLSAILKYLFVDIADISQNKYYILGSFAIRKERTISDLDINMDSYEFFKLKPIIDKGFGGLEIYNKQIRWFFDMTNLYNELTGNHEADFSIEAFQKNPNEGFPNEKFSLNYLMEHNGLDQDNNGHQFFKLETLLDWKETMNRPKDQADIELIKNMLYDRRRSMKSSRKSRKSARKSRKSSRKSRKSSRKSRKSAKKRV